MTQNQLQAQSKQVDNQARSIASGSKTLNLLHVDPANFQTVPLSWLTEGRGGAFVKRRPGVCTGLLWGCTTKGVEGGCFFVGAVQHFFGVNFNARVDSR